MLVSTDDIKKALARGQDIYALIVAAEQENEATMHEIEKNRLYEELVPEIKKSLDDISYLSDSDIIEYIIEICREQLAKRKDRV